MRSLLILYSLICPVKAQAATAVMEGIPATKYTIFVDTGNARVTMGTTTYKGGISNVALYISSNVVIGTSTVNNGCVFYASGSATCLSFAGDGSALTGISVPSAEGNTYTSSKTFTSNVLGKSSITANAFFGDGSHLTGLSSAEGNTFTSSKTFTSDVLIKGQLTVVSTAAIQGNAFSVGGSSFSISGGSATVAYRMTAGSFSGDGSALTNLPASGETNTFTSSKTFTKDVLIATPAKLSASSATFVYGITASTGIFSSTLTVQGDAFSVGTTTLTVKNGFVGIGIATPLERLNIAGTSMLLDAQSFGTGATLNINAVSNGNPAIALKAGGVTKGLFFWDATKSSNTLNSTGTTQKGIIIGADDSVTINPYLIVSGTITTLSSITVVGTITTLSSITASGSITAPSFFGNGANLTGIPSTNSIVGVYVLKAGDTMTGQLTNTSTITVQGDSFSVGGSSFTISGGSATVAYLMTAAAFSGDGSALTNLPSTGETNTFTSSKTFNSSVLIKSSETINGQLTVTSSITIVSPLSNAYSFIVTTSAARDIHHFNITNAGRVGIGTKIPQDILEVNGNILLSSATTGRLLGIATAVSPTVGSTLTIRAGLGVSNPGGALILAAGNGSTGSPSAGGEDGGPATLSAGNATDGTGGEVRINAGNGVTGANSSGIAGNVKISAGSAVSADLVGGSVFVYPGIGISSGAVVLAHDASKQLGRVGIGTSGPATLLHMSSGTFTCDGNVSPCITANSSITASAFFGDGSHLGGLSSAEGNTFTSSKTFTTSIALAADNGFVGIGTRGPNSELEVNGSIAMTGGADRTISITSVTNNGNNLTVSAGDADATGNGGDLILTSGDTQDATGTSGNIYLYSADATTDGSVIIGHTGAAIRGRTAIGCATPVNSLDINRSVGIGSYACATSILPTNSLGVSGRIGAGTALPATVIDVTGNFQVGIGVRKSTFTNSADLVMASGSSVTLAGSNGFLTGASSITTTGGLFGASALITGTATVRGDLLISSPGKLSASSATLTYGITASTGIFSSTLTVQGNAFSVGTSSFSVAGGSVTVAYRLTAGSFVGDGSALTGIPSTNSIVGIYVLKAGDSMTGPLQTSSTITVQGNSFSVGTSSFSIGGGSATVAYRMTAGSFSGDGSALTNLPASESNTFTSSKTFTKDVLIASPAKLSASSATLTYGITASTGIFSSTLTVQGDAFSVGTTSLTVKNGNVGIGIVTPLEKLNIAGSSMLLDAQSLGTGATLNINSVSNGNPSVVFKAGGVIKGFAFWDFAASSTTINSTGSSGKGITIGSDDTVTIDPTLTVKGNTFSVGTSSFTVAGGSATVAYRLTAGSFVGDGSLLTGISATEGNTYTSSKTFTSTVTVGYAVTSTTMNYGSVWMNGQTIVASTSVVKVNEVQFTNLDQGYDHYVIFRATMDATGPIGIRFGASGGTAHSSVNKSYCLTNGDGTGGTASTFAAFFTPNGEPFNGIPFRFDIYFSGYKTPGGTNYIVGHQHGGYLGPFGAADICEENGAFTFSNTNPQTSFSILYPCEGACSTTKFSGTIEVIATMPRVKPLF